MAPAHTTRGDYRHWISIEVRWGDMDSVGHVNNSVYFTYCESARISLLRGLGLSGRSTDSQQGPMLVSAACDFIRQVVYPATLDVGTRIDEITQRSFRMAYGLFRQGTDELVAVGSSVNAWTDYAAGRAVPIPDDLRAVLASYQVPQLGAGPRAH
jgi:acyl-CoA thioester hydrolase